MTTTQKWARSVWRGTQYGTASGRTVLLADPCWIFRCPACEYRMTAATGEAIRTVRRMHARTVHPRVVPTVDALDDGSLPAHLAKRGAR